MTFFDNYDFDLLKNEAEKLILNELEIQLAAEQEICKCNDCVVDMAAIALNSVRPMYRYSLLGSLYTEYAVSDQSYVESVHKAVTQAIAKVKKNPSHD